MAINILLMVINKNWRKIPSKAHPLTKIKGVCEKEILADFFFWNFRGNQAQR